MRHLLLALALLAYGSSSMELHEWARVPQVVLHLLEHHSDLGHHDTEGSEHGHAGDHDHSPFSEDGHGDLCACGGLVALPTDQQAQGVSAKPLETTLGVTELPIASGAFTGGVWNPPKA